MPVYKGSWYSQLPAFGWFDPEDRPGSAAYQLGGRPIPDSQQGIALPSRAGLGKWFNVTPPGGNLPFPMQQTDIGPAKWTGRGVDISAAAAHQMGYTPKNFPTDAAWKVEPRDEPRGLGSPPGMPVQAGDIPDNTDDTQTAIASGPPQGRKMPTGLMDMFQPQNPAGEPVGFGDALTSRSNSLIGLGMGLLQPSNPLRGESTWGNALQGYMGGAGLDTRQAAMAAQLKHQKSQDARQAAQDAFQRSQAAQSQSNFERQFARSDPANVPTEFTRAARDLGLTSGTPEHAQFAKQFYSTKSEGNLAAQAEQRMAIAKSQGMDANDPKIKGWIASGGTLNEKPRDLSVTDITKLSEEGGKLSQLGSFHNTFEPRFAGYKSSMLGEAANLAGRNVPGLVGKDVQEGATWWQAYDSYKNTVRHELYGGALTPTEVGVFEKAQINPGMDPKQIEKNLAIQKDIVQNGVKRKANAMISAGYDPKTIADAYGVNLKDIGVTATGRGGGSTPAATTAPAPAPAPAAKSGGQQKTINGKTYTKRDGQWFED